MYKAIALNSGSELEELILAKAGKHFYHRADAEKFDLFPFYCILVSAGTNKNSDHFDPIELYKAKNSPSDKPVNIGHNQKRIIGHMMDCIAVDEDLKPIAEDLADEDIPERLHIVTSAVIYKVWEDPAIQAEVNQIIDKVSKGEIFVSMEALFRDFAYLLTHAGTKEQTIIQRSDKTSALTKYLRQYKGPGRIYNYELARVLKNITFSAVGIVEKPANPESIISANLDLFSMNAKASVNESVYINIEPIIKGEINMSEKADDDMESAKCETDELKKDNANLHSLVAELTTKITALEKVSKKDKEKTSVAEDDTEKEMATLKSTVASLNGELTTLKSDKVTLVTANDALNATVDAFKKASKHSDRVEAMMEADATLKKDKALETVKAFDELSDAGFQQMLVMFKGYATKVPKEVTAETVLATAKVEDDVPMGTTAEASTNKTIADIKNFLTKTKTASAKE